MELSPVLFATYKLLKYLLYPLSWIIALMTLSLFLSLLPASPRRVRWIRLLLASSVALIFLVATPIPGRILIAALEGWYPPFHSTSTSKYDAIVVLAGGIYTKGSLRPENALTDYSRHRTTCGADLFLEGLAPRLLLVGGDSDIFLKGPVESQEMRRWALRLGVPGNAILTEERSRNTYENAANARHLLGKGSILLVTSALHLPRSVALFKKQGFSVTPVPCGYEARDRPGEGLDHLALLDFLPSVHALSISTHAVDEFAGLLVYWIAGTL
ncbi:MAG: YdcF family protein [Nitrospiraceae bacterium]